MARVLIGNWWALAIRGVFAIIFAVIAFVWPGITATVLVLMFGAYTLVDGVFALVAALRAARHHGAVISGIALIAAGIAMIRTNGEWLLVLSGIISVLLGIILFVQPGAGVIALSWWLGVYALLFGISLIGAAFRLRHWHPA
ncbi:MAG: HdeD family acid-resistance protein [Alphaproteobacteria bacterium]|nr:MAG: HdeD family acid-resistance protein [Alphaproteobacteria bacterium]